jgi:glucosamine 6-phosphate synthetase-like amidotransferase/phosphosugar isomerase protein
LTACTARLETPATDELLAPIVNVVPLQYLALEVSRRLGVDADSFRKEGRYAAAQTKFTL